MAKLTRRSLFKRLALLVATTTLPLSALIKRRIQRECTSTPVSSTMPASQPRSTQRMGSIRWLPVDN